VGARGTAGTVMIRGEPLPSFCESRSEWPRRCRQREDGMHFLTEMKSTKMLEAGMVAWSVGLFLQPW
jgi:hypothetical protein